ncbi:sugar phosphate isomerase/epimerase family protein [Spirosoma pollinicola]|uniref:Sugar phosphate isomerase/epimerase n=1 Tax=Spirosoma pollinicola TaxID=2057025 RepID=A0A2K8YY48_9BACT|nr:sugar phosphate isomerase/epimerase family protein [Spirosoma pollinicola]AUD02519.1 sugar phosphate isomerase/epimerase [Spirosoma pollinicola]
MNKIGMNMFVWTMSMDEDLTDTFRFLKTSGFDFVEVPISEPGPAGLDKWHRIGKQISELGLGVQTCTICGPEHSLISSDESVRTASVNYLKQVVDCSRAVGSAIVMGPMYAGFKTFTGKPATAEEWNWSVNGMREVAEYAQTQGVTLAIEYLNRFEIYLLTCADDVVRYVEAVNHPNCRVAFDTFHANMEEKSIGDALRMCAPYLIHVQISENDRSTPGKGHINFEEVFAVLEEVDYAGPIAIEAFGPNPPELAAATHIFRPMFDSPEQLAVDGLDFIKSERAKESKSYIMK